MSIFEKEAKTPTTETASESQQSFLETLVAEKGDRFRDPEELAKSKLHADKYIEELKAENAKLLTYQELVEGLKKDPMAGLDAIVKPEEKQRTTTATLDTTETAEVDLKSQLELLLEERENVKRTQANRQHVEVTLEETFGEKAGEVLQSRAEELGMDLKELAALAEKSPPAFYRLVGIGQKEGKTSAFVPTSVNTEGKSTGARGPEYYVNELKKNPKLYRDSTFTQAMYAAFAKRK